MDRGTRNHILQEAVSDIFISPKLQEDLTVRSHPASPPIQTISNGRIFSHPGRIGPNWFIGSVHNSIAPHIIDMEDIRIMGVTTFRFSEILFAGV